MSLVFSWIIYPKHLCYIIFTWCHDRNGESVFLSHLSTDSECAPQFPGVFSSFLHEHLQLAPHQLEHMPSPCGQSEASLQPAQGWQTALDPLCLKINTVTLAKGSAAHQPRLPKRPILELVFVFQTLKHKCPLHMSWNPSPGQTGNTLDTMSIWKAISKDSLDQSFYNKPWNCNNSSTAYWSCA